MRPLKLKLLGRISQGDRYETSFHQHQRSSAGQPEDHRYQHRLTQVGIGWGGACGPPRKTAFSLYLEKCIPLDFIFDESLGILSFKGVFEFNSSPP
jgi:hypothetical protein